MGTTNRQVRKIAQIENRLRALKRYNCDCLPNGADGLTMATDEEAQEGDSCYYCERQVLLDADVAGVIGMLRTLREELQDELPADPASAPEGRA